MDQASTSGATPAEPSALAIAAAMAQGVLASGVAGPYGLPASALVGGALQLATMFHGGAGKVVTVEDLEKLRDDTGANLAQFSANVDRMPS